MLINNKIYSKESDVHGYGVFAKEDINKGEIIEECPVIIIRSSNYYNLQRELKEYVFSWKENGNQTPAVIMGYGGVYNHSDKCSAHFYCDNEKRVMVYRAIKNIKKDEEIFLNYGDEYFDILQIKKVSI